MFVVHDTHNYVKLYVIEIKTHAMNYNWPYIRSMMLYKKILTLWSWAFCSTRFDHQREQRVTKSGTSRVWATAARLGREGERESEWERERARERERESERESERRRQESRAGGPAAYRILRLIRIAPPPLATVNVRDAACRPGPVSPAIGWSHAVSLENRRKMFTVSPSIWAASAAGALQAHMYVVKRPSGCCCWGNSWRPICLCQWIVWSKWVFMKMITMPHPAARHLCSQRQQRKKSPACFPLMLSYTLLIGDALHASDQSRLFSIIEANKHHGRFVNTVASLFVADGRPT